MSQIITIKIPSDLTFADLKLARDPDGMVSFDMGVIEKIEMASGLPAGYFMGRPEGELAGLLNHWYQAHLADGGAPDPAQEDLITEVKLEDQHGGGLSHQPGSA